MYCHFTKKSLKKKIEAFQQNEPQQKVSGSLLPAHDAGRHSKFRFPQPTPAVAAASLPELQMVKAVVGEETRLQLSEDRLSQSGISAQVGLVIGKLSAPLDRGFVLDLVPTPPNDAGEPPCSLIGAAAAVVKDEKKRGSKAKNFSSDSSSSSLSIDKDWIAEHARQVSRMLVGGIKVIGIYVWSSDVAIKNSTIELCQTVKAVAQAAPISVNDWDERLLIHICSSPRRWACRNCSLASNITSSSLHPCDFKMGRVFSSLQAFRCTYKLDLRLPIFNEDRSSLRTLNDILQNAISIHARELKGAKAIVDGNLASDDEPCTSNGLHEVELLLPFMRDASLEASSQKTVTGILVLAGSLCSYAYLSSKEPISQALHDIKEDIITSLQSRLAIICDEADREMGTMTDVRTGSNSEITTPESINQQILQPMRKQCNVPLPRRVFIPWIAGTFICDHLQPSETFEVLKDHFVELLSMEAPVNLSEVVEPETEALCLTTRSFWDAVASSSPASVLQSLSSKSKDDHSGKGTRNIEDSTPENVNGVVAVVILLLSILAGLLLYSVYHL
ncbi:hypothetical protein Dimus_027898 [Dionaea muscipula]